MPIKICLQAGHEGRTSGSTGAPGEVELNVRIRNRLSELLIERGFQLYLVNADPKVSQINQDFDLFLALHGDADIYGTGGGFADYPDPSTDKATVESQRICKVINETYFPETQIKYVNRSNKNTRFYYMWKQLSYKTPCVIIEMGVVQDAHDKVLLANTELIAGALKKSICKAFNVPESSPPETPTEPEPEPEPGTEPETSQCEKELVYQKGEVLRLNKLVESTKNEYEGKIAQKDKDCQSRIDTFKDNLIKYIKEYL